MACIEESFNYCHERETFGKAIGKHQLVQQMIAKMEAGLQMSRLLVYRAGELKNQGKRNTRETSLAKWQDRKSTRLNSSHVAISYAVFCLKKKKKKLNNNI